MTLLAYPLAVGCASVSAVKQETEAVLQVNTPHEIQKHWQCRHLAPKRRRSDGGLSRSLSTCLVKQAS